VFIELVDDLRCPRPHEETWLVASAVRTEGRDILEGTLGCPICHAEYPIRDGTVWFDDSRLVHARASAQADPALAMRLAAFLDLSDTQGFAILSGMYGQLAELLRGVVPPHLIALNPVPPLMGGDGVSALVIHAGIPLAAATCRGVALDAAHAGTGHLEEAIRVLQPHGRLVAPATTALPPGVSEIARDEQLWVAERTAAPPKLVRLRGRGS
jgi:uncharacterized protein YbaR (Trm112 family)